VVDPELEMVCAIVFPLLFEYPVRLGDEAEVVHEKVVPATLEVSEILLICPSHSVWPLGLNVTLGVG
jgi:hypothetical protein